MNARTTTEPRFDADDRLGVDAEFDAGPSLRREMQNGRSKSSIMALLRELTQDGRDMVSLEIELAKAEMHEKAEVYGRNAATMGAGAAVLLAALLLGAWTLTMGLTALLETFLPVEIAVWLAPLILTVVFGAIGYSMVKKGLEAIQRESPAPRKTIQALKDDKRWAERKVHS